MRKVKWNGEPAFETSNVHIIQSLNFGKLEANHTKSSFGLWNLTNYVLVAIKYKEFHYVELLYRKFIYSFQTCNFAVC